MRKTGVLLLLFPVYQARAATEDPLLRTVDLDLGTGQNVKLSDGTTSRVTLLATREFPDPIRDVIRRSEVDVRVNDATVTLACGEYNLPIDAGGVQVDCALTNGLYKRSSSDFWSLSKRARVRLWPAGSPWASRTPLVYPAVQRWFLTDTWYNNEPVDADLSRGEVYYHAGLDIGGTEGLVDVVAATDGTVVSLKGVLWDRVGPDYPSPTTGGGQILGDPTRPDVVYIRDARDWYYRYSHLKSVDARLALGQPIKAGDKVGIMGKEGASGGWAHLHFEALAKQPSGRWGSLGSYALLWEAYVRQYAPPLIAVARPGALGVVGDKIPFDGSASWSASGKIARYEWSFADGTTTTGARVEHVYEKPGCFWEALAVHDEAGAISYDFRTVIVVTRAAPVIPPWVSLTYAPSLALHPGDPINFQARAFGYQNDAAQTADEDEHWDFGDGSARVTTRSDVRSDAHDPKGYVQVVHRFAKPGHYIVRVERASRLGGPAFARVHVEVLNPDAAPPDAGRPAAAAGDANSAPDGRLATGDREDSEIPDAAGQPKPTGCGCRVTARRAPAPPWLTLLAFARLRARTRPAASGGAARRAARDGTAGRRAS